MEMDFPPSLVLHLIEEFSAGGSNRFEARNEFAFRRQVPQLLGQVSRQYLIGRRQSSSPLEGAIVIA